MGTTSGPSDDECLAARAFAALTSLRLEPGEDGRPDRADWTIVVDGEVVGVLEVSRVTDEGWHELRRLLEQRPRERVVDSTLNLSVVAENVTSCCWGLVIRPGTSLRQLATALSRNLQRVEGAGIEFFIDGDGRPDDVPPLNDEARALLAAGVVSARVVDSARDHSDHTPKVFVTIGLSGGGLDPCRTLNSAVEVSCTSNANKLASGRQTHLWLWVDEGTHLAAVLSIRWMEEYLTACRPEIPSWLTKVWLALEPNDDDASELLAHRIWAVEPGGVWKLEAESV